MTWTTPVSPVSGTVITVAWATSNVVDPITWLRLMTGNADPPGSAYLIRSTSTTATAWSKLTADLIPDGIITAAKLVDAYLKLTGGTLTGDLHASSANIVFDSVDRGLVLALGTQQYDTNSPSERLAIRLAGSRLSTYTEDGLTELLRVDTTEDSPRYKNHPLVKRDGDTLTGDLSMTSASIRALTDLFGMVFSSGTSIFDRAATEAFVMRVAGNRLEVLREDGSANILTATPSALTYLTTDVMAAIAAKLPLAGGTLTGNVHLTSASVIADTDLFGMALSSGSSIFDRAATEAMILRVAGNRLEVQREDTAAVLLLVTPSVFQYLSQDVIHSGNIGSQSVASATTAGTASAIVDGAVSTTAKMADSIVTSAKIVDGTITLTDMAASASNPAAGTAGLRSIGTGATEAAAGNHAHTAMAKIHSGSYSGNSGTRAVTGVGFAPSTIFVIDGTGTAGGLIQNAVVISWNSGGATGAGTATMDSDGFTLTSSILNVSGHTYTYVAIG